jgi:hypothetical protein
MGQFLFQSKIISRGGIERRSECEGCAKSNDKNAEGDISND